MPVTFDSSMPIYLQIIDMIRQTVAAGAWPPGSKVASVRDLAIEFGVNPNTMQRALSELERDGLLLADRTAGRYVTTDRVLVEKLRGELAGRRIGQLLEQMAALGYNKEQVLRILQEKWSESDGHD
jgi:GntR family transcriptional regulator